MASVTRQATLSSSTFQGFGNLSGTIELKPLADVVHPGKSLRHDLSFSRDQVWMLQALGGFVAGAQVGADSVGAGEEGGVSHGRSYPIKSDN